MDNLTIRFRFRCQVISDHNNILTVAIFFDDKLASIIAGEASELFSRLESLFKK